MVGCAEEGLVETGPLCLMGEETDEVTQDTISETPEETDTSEPTEPLADTQNDGAIEEGEEAVSLSSESEGCGSKRVPIAPLVTLLLSVVAFGGPTLSRRP